MFKFLITFALLLTVALGGIQPSVPHSTGIEHQHASTHKITMRDDVDPTSHGHCSATAIAPHALLTAGHCFMNSNKIVLDKEKTDTVILLAIQDGADHVIYIVDRTFTDYLPLTQRALVPLEAVHMWGNPGKQDDVYRDGFYRDTYHEDEVNRDLQRFTLPIFPGDSGSGILDSTGHIIAVITFGDRSADEMSLPLAFTADQLKVVQ